MSQLLTDRNLLFGIIALQMDFVSRGALIAAMNAWVLEKEKPLGLILVDQGTLRDDEHRLLEALVWKYLEKHGGDAEQSLASLSPVGWMRSLGHALLSGINKGTGMNGINLSINPMCFCGCARVGETKHVNYPYVYNVLITKIP